MVSTANEELTGLANSIRTKTNTTDKMTIVEMTEAVENLSIGGDNSEFLSLLTDTPTTGYTIAIPEGITKLKKGVFTKPNICWKLLFRNQSRNLAKNAFISVRGCQK